MRTLLASALLLCLAAVAVAPTASALQDPLGCGSSVGVCVTNHTPAGQCVLVHVGLQGAGVCVDLDPLAVRVCSSMYVDQVGRCPTDAVGEVLP